MSTYTLYNYPGWDPTLKHVPVFRSKLDRAQCFLNLPVQLSVNNAKRWVPGTPLSVQIPFRDADKYNYAVISNGGEEPDYYMWIVGHRKLVSGASTGKYLVQLDVELDVLSTFAFVGEVSIWQDVYGWIKRTTSSSIAPIVGLPSDLPVISKVVANYAWTSSIWYAVAFSVRPIDNLANISANTPYRAATIHGVSMSAPPYLFVGSQEAITANIASVCAAVNRTGSPVSSWLSGIYAVPAEYVTVNGARPQVSAMTDDDLAVVTRNFNPPTSCEGYVPSVRWLLGQDYSTVTVSNGEGTTAVFRFDDFSSGVASFSSTLDVSGGYPSIKTAPNGLRELTQSVDALRNYIVTTSQPLRMLTADDGSVVAQAQTANSRAAAIDGARMAIEHANLNRQATQISLIGGGAASALTGILPALSGDMRGVLSGASQYLVGTGSTTIQGASSSIADAVVFAEGGGREMLAADMAVSDAGARARSIVAQYADQRSVPDTIGSSGYGGLARYQQYGPSFTVTTPTAQAAQQIDKLLQVNGITVEREGWVTQDHRDYDYYELVAEIPQSPGLPEYARSLMRAVLAAGAYLWWSGPGISSMFGCVMSATNPEV